MSDPRPTPGPPRPGPPRPGLELAATVAQRDFDASLSVARGETVAVLGPNGAGKSTLLGVLAGLVRPSSGRAVLDGDVLFDLPDGRRPTIAPTGPGGRRTWTPPHARGVTLLAQEALLFPHLTARQNVEFGPRSRGESRAAARAAGERWLAQVDALDLADRRPAELSGGQAQRVALARALASEPRLLLLDEPMAALDVHVRPTLRRMLREVLADRTAVIVTHDVLDALVLADRVIVIADGRIRADGPTRDVLERPTDPFTAELASLNLVIGTARPAGGAGFAEADAVAAEDAGVADAGTFVAADLGVADAHASATADVGLAEAVEIADGRRLPFAPVALPAGSTIGVAIPPSALTIVSAGAASGSDEGGGGNRGVEAVVQDLEPRGDLVRVRTELLFLDLPPTSVADLDLAAGARIRLRYDPSDALAYPLPA